MTNSATKVAKPRGRIPAVEIAQHEEALLQASLDLFRDHGFARVSIDMIARAARVSPKTIYVRYGGKRGLFAAVIERMVAQPLATLSPLNGANGDPAATLRQVGAAFLDSILEPEKVALHRMLIAEATRMPELSGLFYKQGPAKALNLLATWLAAQDEAGLLRVPDPKIAAEIFVGLIEARFMFRALLLGVIPAPKERAESLDYAVDIFVDAHAR